MTEITKSNKRAFLISVICSSLPAPIATRNGFHSHDISIFEGVPPKIDHFYPPDPKMGSPGPPKWGPGGPFWVPGVHFGVPGVHFGVRGVQNPKKGCHNQGPGAKMPRNAFAFTEV